MIFGRKRRDQQDDDAAKAAAPPAGPPEVEELGTVTTSSGDLVLIDFGLLNLWSGEAEPALDPDVMGDSLAEKANTAVDLMIVGDDAVAAGRATDLWAVDGRYVFDIPADGVGEMQERVAGLAREHGFDVRVEPMPRMPHRTRVARLLDDLPDGAEVQFGGPWAWAVRGLPRDRPLPVRGVRMPSDGPDAGNWHSIWVEVDPRPPARSVDAGHVAVDEARLAFADPDALTVWRTNEAVDGRADVAFWGADDQIVAGRTGAGRLDDDVFGWADLPVGEAVDRVRELHRMREEEGVRFAFDFRPHDDHHRLLGIARTVATGGASIAIGPRTVYGFFTSWGDGAFPVRRDLADDGTLCRVRVELGAPEIVQRQRRFEERWFGALSLPALVSARVAGEGAPIGWLYREAPDNERDSGWRVFAGDESQEYLDDDANVRLLPLRDLLGHDEQLEALFRTPAPAAFELGPDGAYRPAPPPEG